MIYQTINNVMSEIGAIGKGKRSQQGFLYRGVDDVMNALAPAFIRHKLFTVPEILEQKREERTTGKGGLLIYSICKIRYTFYAEDGSHVEVVTIGEGMDSGDKATNKAMAIAFKYACFQLFCIPTEEMVDPDAETHKPQPAAGQKKGEARAPQDCQGMAIKDAQKAGQPAAENVEKATPEMIEAIRNLVEKYSHKGLKMDKILKMYSIKDMTEMNVSQYKDCMTKLELYKKKEPEESKNE